MRPLRAFLLLSFFSLVHACVPDQGIVTVRAYGESFIEDGIPASELEDGWAIEFSRFEVSFAGVWVADTEISITRTVDLSEPSSGDGHELGSKLVAVGAHEQPSFTITRVEIDGRATKDGEVKTFEWVFDEPIEYGECETTTEVTSGDEATFQITVHADHLFYDSLVSADPSLSFQPLADADSDDDGAITEAELAVADIGAYDPGSEGGVDDLWAWLEAQARTLGHVDGEGHCHDHGP